MVGYEDKGGLAYLWRSGAGVINESLGLALVGVCIERTTDVKGDICLAMNTSNLSPPRNPFRVYQY